MSPSLAALRLQCTPRQTFQTGYGGRIRTYVNEFQKLAPFQLGHSVRIFDLVDLARFERATSTFAESRSDSAELQVLRFGISECGSWIRKQSAFCSPQSTIGWRKGQDLNLQATNAR